MRLGLAGILLLGICLAGCSSTSTTTTITPIGSAAGGGGAPQGARQVTLTSAEIAIVRRDVAAAFRDPGRPLFDTMAGAQDSKGVRYACGTIFGKAESGGNPSPLPYAGMFAATSFAIIAKGGSTAETRAAEDACRRLGILPQRR